MCAVFITHQHEDHYSGLEYLKDNGYQMDYLIYSPYKRRLGDSSVEYNDWRVFESYVDHFDRNGAICYTPYRQSDSSEPWRRLHVLISGLLDQVKISLQLMTVNYMTLA